MVHTNVHGLVNGVATLAKFADLSLPAKKTTRGVFSMSTPMTIKVNIIFFAKLENFFRQRSLIDRVGGVLS